nr:hypothetical protein [Campylobacter sp.]
MIQPARSSHSTSFLREARDALVLIDDEKTRDYFLQKIALIIENRENPDKLFTGARATKEQLLAYLKQQGEIKTANVWCRNLIIDYEKIAELKQILGKRLLQNGIVGVLEIHLQDREINSPHIQFIGTNAEFAEQIIAQTLVRMNYEMNLESAMGKKDFKPRYLQEQDARINDLQENLEINEYTKEQEKIKAEQGDDLNEFLISMKRSNRRTIKQIDEICKNLKQESKMLKRAKEIDEVRFKGSRKQRIRNLKMRIHKRKR